MGKEWGEKRCVVGWGETRHECLNNHTRQTKRGASRDKVILFGR